MVRRGLHIGAMTLLFTALLGSSINSEALAKESDEQTRISAEWIDPELGTTYYNWSHYDGMSYESKVIISSSDGQWSRLPDKYTSVAKLHGRQGLNLSEAWVISDLPQPFYALPYRTSLTLDTKNDRVIKGHTYDLSPDGKWGLLETYNPIAQLSLDGVSVNNGQMHSYLLKNLKTGVITEWMTVQESVRFEWLPDNTLLVNRYVPKEKQREIYKYNPETDTSKRLVLGTLSGYSEKSQLIMFSYNEPKRKSWVFDLRSGRIRAYKSPQDDNHFTWTDDRPKVETPKALDIEKLPINDLPVVNLGEHEIVTAKGSVYVPFSFVSKGDTYIPIQPLLEKLQLQVGPREGNSYNYQYTVTGNGLSVVFDRHNSQVFQFRLFVTPEGLEKLGYSDNTIRSVEHYS